MFSQRTMSALLIAAIVTLSYQTVVLASMSSQLEDAKIGVGVSASAVSFSDDGSAPAMVGGC